MYPGLTLRSNASSLGEGLKQKDDWEIHASEIEISKRADGSDWVLGDGAFGQVCTRHNCPPFGEQIVRELMPL